MSLRIVLDPDVLVLGVVAPGQPEGRLLDLVVTGSLTILVNDLALDAYRRALGRPDLELPPAPAHHLVDFLASTGMPVAPSGCALHPSHPLADLAIDGHADALVVADRAPVPERLRRRLPAETAATLLARLR